MTVKTSKTFCRAFFVLCAMLLVSCKPPEISRAEATEEEKSEFAKEYADKILSHNTTSVWFVDVFDLVLNVPFDNNHRRMDQVVIRLAFRDRREDDDPKEITALIRSIVSEKVICRTKEPVYFDNAYFFNDNKVLVIHGICFIDGMDVSQIIINHLDMKTEGVE